MKSEYKSIFVFGLALAFIIAGLKFFEYKYFIGSFSQDVYTTIIAIVCTIVGVWLGVEFFYKKSDVNQQTSINSDQKDAFNLNNREYEILNLIAKGLTNQAIADHLYIALPTVKTHVSNLYSKLDVKNRTQAVHKARLSNLII